MRGKFFNHKLASLLLVGIFIFGNIAPVQAAETKQVHPWAVETLVDGEKYGIYPIAWYDSMQAPMTNETLVSFMGAIRDKIGQIDGVKQKAQGQYDYSGKVTRESVLKALYHQLQEYSYPVDIRLDDTDAINYLQKIGVVVGDAKGLRLEDPCNLEEAALFGTRLIDYIYETQNAGAKGIFFKVTKGENTVYMLGSIHIADYSIYPFNDKLMDAFEEADTIGFEVNLYNQEGLNDFMQLITYKDGTQLKEHISEELYSKTVEAATKVGIPEEQVALCKPWYIANSLTTMASSGSENTEEAQLASLLGVDNYFLAKTTLEGKEIYEFEGYAYQGKLFDEFSSELQDYYLSSAVDAILNDEAGSSAVETVNDWLAYWKDGDLEGFTTSYDKDGEVEETYQKEFMEKLFTIRDTNMASQIDSLLNQEGHHTYFMIVGAAHYIGESGVVAQLRNKGYEVTQIK